MHAALEVDFLQLIFNNLIAGSKNHEDFSVTKSRVKTLAFLLPLCFFIRKKKKKKAAIGKTKETGRGCCGLGKWIGKETRVQQCACRSLWWSQVN